MVLLFYSDNPLYSIQKQLHPADNTCINCHKATNFEFNQVKIPDSPPFSNQISDGTYCQSKKRARALIDHLRKDVERLQDPSAKALFEVSAEVITGLGKAFTDYEQKNEAAWRK
jgi:hypothetical protein